MYPYLNTTPMKNMKQEANLDPPEIIGFFSIDSQRQCSIDAGHLKYVRDVKDRRVNFDLNLGWEETIYKDDIIDEKLSQMLHFLSVKENDLNLQFATSIKKSRFCCNRGLLTAVSYTPYENNEPWRIVATLFKGDIYLCKRPTEKYLNEHKNMKWKHRQATGWGHKFEHFLSTFSPKSKPNPNEILNQNEEFNVVFQSNIKEHSLIYGAEMDGLICNENTEIITDTSFKAVINYLKSNEFVELKTNIHIETSNQRYTFRQFKTLKWWCQNHLVGCNKILCGVRNQKGIVEKLKLYTLSDLVQNSQGWQPQVCQNFLYEFLSYVKRCLELEIKMKHGDKTDFLKLPVISLHFEWQPRSPVRVTSNYDYESDPILTEEFVKNYGKTRIARLKNL